MCGAYMNKKLFTKDNYYLVLYTIICAFFFRNWILFAAAMVTSSFTNVSYCLSIVFSSTSVLIHIFNMLGNKYVKKHNKVKKIISNSIECLFGVLGIAFYMMSSNTHLGNVSLGIDSYMLAIITPISCICTIMLPLVQLFDKRQIAQEIDYERPYKELKPLKKVLLFFSCLMALYSLANLFISIFVFENIERYALGFISILLFLLVCVYNFIYEVINIKNKNNKINIVTICVNLLTILLFVVA